MRAAARILILLLSACPAGLTLAAEGDQYMVEMELWTEGQQRGTPIVVVAPGEQASVELGDDSGEGGWKIDVLLDPPAAAEGAPVGAIWLNLTVHELRDGEWEPLADSLLGVPEGRSASMSVVEAGVEQATPENSVVYLTAQASLLRPGASES